MTLSTECQETQLHPEAIQKAQAQPLDPTTFQAMINLFKALSDETRAQIIWYLSQSELCVCDIAYLLQMTKSAVSHQLTYLHKLNLVKRRKQGRNVFYSIADDHVRTLFENALEHASERKEDLQ